MEYKIPESYDEAKTRYDEIIKLINEYNEKYFTDPNSCDENAINDLINERDFLKEFVDDMQEEDKELLSRIDQESGAYTKKAMIIKMIVIFSLSIILNVIGYVFSFGTLLFLQFLSSTLYSTGGSQFIKNLYATSGIFEFICIFFIYALYPAVVMIITTICKNHFLKKSEYTKKISHFINLGLWIINLIIVIIITVQFIPTIISTVSGG